MSVARQPATGRYVVAGMEAQPAFIYTSLLALDRFPGCQARSGESATSLQDRTRSAAQAPTATTRIAADLAASRSQPACPPPERLFCALEHTHERAEARVSIRRYARRELMKRHENT